MTVLKTQLRPDPSRTVVRPFEVGDPAGYMTPGQTRAQRIVTRLLALEGVDLARECEETLGSLTERHRSVEAVLMRRFKEVDGLHIDKGAIGHDHALLIGAYFSEEYSFEAAALFNPSAVLHPDQTGLPQGAVRVLLSLRCIGEGHISSVTFRTAVWSPGAEIEVDAPSRWAVAPMIENGGNAAAPFMRLHCGGSREVSETVIFPVTPSQKQGIEDLRLVRFTTATGKILYLGTYTAYSGAAIGEEMLRTADFSAFDLHPLAGGIAASKGMALFPRQIDGRYLMLGRQDNENLWLIASDDLFTWNGGTKIVEPRYPWEFVQMGNCGSPIEIEEGWLVLTHGVGTVRNYCVGACLLDKADPSKLLARTSRPLIAPDPSQRDGYVPNVVYSCGGLVEDRTLLLPYGVADNFAMFATASVDAVLAAMT